MSESELAAPPKPKPAPKPAPKLDKSRPYGTVHGSERPGLYEQDGKLFDADGNLVK